MIKPKWLELAEKHIGLKEVPGKGNNPKIINWLATLNAWWRNDLEPWCGTFTGAMFREAGVAIPKAWYRAKAWLDWGVVLSAPVYGCVVVFTRDGGGHVGIVVGHDAKGRLMVLGGNQKDAVSVAPFERARVAGYRYPAGYNYTHEELPLYDSSAVSSTNER
jgi:uncharacterized protein (TIGR02594 family)